MTPFTRGARFAHHIRLDPSSPHVARKPQVVQVTSTKRYTRSTGEDSTRIYFRPVFTYCTGRESLGALSDCDIEDAANWTPAG